MTESKKLTLLRDRLIRRRREIVGHLQTTFLDQDSGDDLADVAAVAIKLEVAGLAFP